MWLIHTTTLRLHLFTQGIPDYAILSHRWEEQEVSFRQFSEADMVRWDGDDSDNADELKAFPHLGELIQYRRKKLLSKKGFKKIGRFCEQARAKGYNWGWVDTCCIDKSSSAELQEAVNSMFQWYYYSSICIVYLSDVEVQESLVETLKQFRKSEWFKRGWTLQELMAPSALDFVDCKWTLFGNKESLLEDISLASRIPTEAFGRVYDGDDDFPNYVIYNVAERMSWAAERQTTRPEDRAYCLFGLFLVNMPLIYGEGGRSAFLRLQQEILKYSTDETIFASQFWSELDQSAPGGLLADEPRDFLHSAVELHKRDSPQFVTRLYFESTTLGLRIETVLLDSIAGIELAKEFTKNYIPKDDVIFMPLRCSHRGTGEVMLIPLLRLSAEEGNKYVRAGRSIAAPCDMKSLFARGPRREIYVALSKYQAFASIAEFASNI